MDNAGSPQWHSSKLAGSLGVSDKTINHYLDILEGALVIKRLQPYFANVKKRLVKSPQVYIYDSGLVHALLNIKSYNDLLSHLVLGSSFESMVISSLLHNFSKHKAFFYRDSTGSKLDLILEKGQSKIAFEIKASSAPIISKHFYKIVDLLDIKERYVIAQINEAFPVGQNTWEYSIKAFLEEKIQYKNSNG